jgi:adenylate kinase
VAQAEALDVMLQGKGKTLDAVVQLEVDDAILLSRIEKRASETEGGPRADDNAKRSRSALMSIMRRPRH